jgi:hypothetical protein
MNKITKAWTYGVAYLSLAVGSGVSISGNIADTYRVAGAIGRVPDGLDIAISAFWPAAVLLAIEMFVSRLWPKTTPMQSVRWLGSLGIGFVAMYVSWHHLADLLSSRGQDGVVSSIGPLAIDGLAVMATGLILSSRGHRIADTDIVAKADTVLDALAAKDMNTVANWNGPAATAEDVAESEAALRGDLDVSAPDEIPSWMDGLAARVDNTTTPAHPLNVITPRWVTMPDAAREHIQAWLATPADQRPTAGDMAALLAAEHGRDPRTIRRWVSAAKNAL